LKFIEPVIDLESYVNEEAMNKAFPNLNIYPFSGINTGINYTSIRSQFDWIY